MDRQSTAAVDRAWAAFADAIRPDLDAVRDAVADLLDEPGTGTADRFLAAAPVDACVRLADAWLSAEAVGLPADRAAVAFDAEDRSLLELVAAVFAGVVRSAGCRVRLPDPTELAPGCGMAAA